MDTRSITDEPGYLVAALLASLGDQLADSDPACCTALDCVFRALTDGESPDQATAWRHLMPEWQRHSLHLGGLHKEQTMLLTGCAWMLAHHTISHAGYPPLLLAPGSGQMVAYLLAELGCAWADVDSHERKPLAELASMLSEPPADLAHVQRTVAAGLFPLLDGHDTENRPGVVILCACAWVLARADEEAGRINPAGLH